MDANRGKSLEAMTPAELDAEAGRRRRLWESAIRYTSQCYRDLAKAVEASEAAEHDYNVAARLANLARGKVGAVGAVLAAMGALGDPVAALFG